MKKITMSSFSIRVPEETHAQLRIIAAFRNTSVNTVINEALTEAINQWVQKYGPLPLPPEEFR
ncbi:MAG: toxin-antitoxin system HicB family antitoxin [Synergistaceae bacterium]|nr:toxin-antitoxin system HicB family antitoxin [Synergistaceae bacterium]MBR0080089.1 toxin-antitoxin system HicB family antitoxin [Synergistaceae bacterium]MBR0315913.1 toxin-antitoxin system HicB family antitoxin [Synergistaceae bacterium]